MRITRRGLIAVTPVTLAAVFPVLPTPPDPDPDAALIAACARHAVAHEQYNRFGGHLDADKDPLWAAYDETLDAIQNAQPATLSGLIAKARAARIEALQPDGTEDANGSVAEVWAWQIVGDLIRLSAVH